MRALVEAAVRKDSALVVGLDPDPSRFPSSLSGLPEARATREFCLGLLEAVEPFAAVIKPQSACFERLGPEGARVYEEVIRASQELGLPVIADVKRGDIGESAVAYARAHLGTFGAECVTVNPYMGADAVEPFLSEVRSLNVGGGVFVLVATSNPSSADLQGATSPPLYEVAARLVADIGEMTGSGYPDAGAVVGVTRPEAGARVRELLPKALFLAPGFGAQGGGASSVTSLMDARGGGVLVSSSRGIIFAHESEGSPDYQRAAARAAERARDELRGVGIRW